MLGESVECILHSLRNFIALCFYKYWHFLIPWCQCQGDHNSLLILLLYILFGKGVHIGTKVLSRNTSGNALSPSSPSLLTHRVNIIYVGSTREQRLVIKKFFQLMKENLRSLVKHRLESVVFTDKSERLVAAHLESNPLGFSILLHFKFSIITAFLPNFFHYHLLPPTTSPLPHDDRDRPTKTFFRYKNLLHLFKLLLF